MELDKKLGTRIEVVDNFEGGIVEDFVHNPSYRRVFKRLGSFTLVFAVVSYVPASICIRLLVDMRQTHEQHSNYFIISSHLWRVLGALFGMSAHLNLHF